MKVITLQEFLPYFPGTIFQTFHDVNKGANARSYEAFNEQLFRNLNKQPIGIFFSVNSFTQHRSAKCHRECKVESCTASNRCSNPINHLTKLNGVYADADIAKDGDGQSIEIITEKKRSLFAALENAPIPPNFIIETKNGLQPIWLLLEDLVTPEIQSVYKEILKGVREFTVAAGAMGDPVYDVERVLRLPGYLHQKSDAFEVKVFKINETRHVLVDLRKAFPYFDTELISKDNQAIQREFGNSTSLLDVVDIRDVALMALKEWGEPTAYFDTIGRVVIARGVTGAFQGKNGDGQYIASNSHDIPHGNKVTFVQRLLHLPDNKTAFKKICEWFNIEFKHYEHVQSNSAQKTTTTTKEKKIIRQPRSMQEVVTDAKKTRELEKSAPLTGYPEIDEKIQAWYPGKLTVFTGSTNVGKTAMCCNFSVEIVRQNKKVLYIALEPEESVAEYLASILYDKKFEDVTVEDLDALATNDNIKFYYKKDIDSEEELIQAVKQADKIFDFIVIDHIGYFAKEGNDYLIKQSNTVRTLVELTRSAEAHIVAIAHPRKPAKGKGINQPLTMFDIAGSAAFYQDAHNVIVLNRGYNEDMSPAKYGQLHLYKVKKGLTGIVDIIFYEKSARMTTMMKHYQEKEKKNARQPDEEPEQKSLLFVEPETERLQQTTSPESNIETRLTVKLQCSKHGEQPHYKQEMQYICILCEP